MPAPERRYEIAVRVRSIMQLFNSLDPSPFRERDLDPHTEEFVVGWARELPYAAPFAIGSSCRRRKRPSRKRRAGAGEAELGSRLQLRRVPEKCLWRARPRPCDDWRRYD
jgi:hypothetical protein